MLTTKQEHILTI